MRYKKLKLSALFLLSIGLPGIRAQEAVIASGGNASGTGGSGSYSVGQIAYTTNSNSNGSVAQGVQQVFVITVVTSIEEAMGINLTCMAYPNPAADFVNLNVENYDARTLNYELFDIQGKRIAAEKIEFRETNIDLSILVPSTYFLKVIQSNKEVKTFKIIKN